MDNYKKCCCYCSPKDNCTVHRPHILLLAQSYKRLCDRSIITQFHVVNYIYLKFLKLNYSQTMNTVYQDSGELCTVGVEEDL